MSAVLRCSVSMLLALVATTAAAAEAPDVIRFYHTDALGSVRVVSDVSGEVVSRHDYLPFGEEVWCEIGGRDAFGYCEDNSDLSRRFIGQERDAESGLDRFGIRYFASVHGRFTTTDPENFGADVLFPQSWNAYVYAFNNPLTFSDPSGLKPCKARKDEKGGDIVDCDEEIQVTAAEPDLKRNVLYVDFFDARVWADAFGAGFFPALGRGRQAFMEDHQRMFAGFSPFPTTRSGFVLAMIPMAGKGVQLGTSPTTQKLLGTARDNLLAAAQHPRLRKLIDFLYRADAKVGNGSTADAVRHELTTGKLLSTVGHTQKAREGIAVLERLLKGNFGRLDPKDAEIARQIMDDLASALAGK